MGHRRRRARAATSSGSSPGATSRPTASSTPPRCCAGDPSPIDGEPLELARGIEIGHIFQLGRKYAEALGLTVLGPEGKPVVVTMGSYGIGVSRAVAAIAETSYDELGLCWPREVAPADVHVVIAGKPGAEQWPAGERLAADLEAAGVRVLLDDRSGVSPGVKFKDAELIGVPTIVVVGRGIRPTATGRRRGQGPPHRRAHRRPRRPTPSPTSSPSSPPADPSRPRPSVRRSAN